MERESFEDPETASYMNEHFVPIKVDREERPDVDSIYMEAVQGMTGHGGWPLTAFLDPDGVPFYGGTYFPPEPRQGMPSFRMVMEAVVESWTTQRERIRASADRIREQLGAIGRIEPSDDEPSPDILDAATRKLRALADMRHGGFGSAPKFPPASALELLLARGVTDVVETTLDAMAHGGIYDQIGGGFARYSVDDVWLVPHFEKMLYDNALLARTYLHAWQALGHDRYRRVCEETLVWALREMRGPEGGFHSALDADSDGEEGRFYLWTPDQIREALAGVGSSGLADQVIAYYGVTEEGNFEGRNILNLPGGPAAEPPEGLEEARRALYTYRSRRIWPGKDDKRLCSWNALMIGALAEAGGAIPCNDYLNAAVACAEFVWRDLRDERGRLLRTYKDGRAHLAAYLEDYAYLVEALLALYEATFDVRWFDAARETADQMIERVRRRRPRRLLHHRTRPRGVGREAQGCRRPPDPVGELRGGLRAPPPRRADRRARVRAPRRRRLPAAPPRGGRPPAGTGASARARWTSTSRRSRRWRWCGEPSGDGLGELATVVRSGFRPHVVLAGGPEGVERPELMRERTAVDGRPAAYVCEHFSCRQPVTEPAELSAALGDGA